MPTQNSEKRIKEYVRELKELEDNCFRRRGRYWADPFLGRIYKLYANWKKKGLDAARKKDLVKYVLPGSSVRSDQTLLHVMLDCMSRANPKTRNLWTRALLMAEIKGIKPEVLSDFLRGQGGIAGRANDYAAHKRNQKAKKRKPSGSPSTKVSLKNVPTSSNVDDDDWE